MMNYQPQYIQKREIGDIRKLNTNTNLKKKTWIIQFNQKMPLHKDDDV